MPETQTRRSRWARSTLRALGFVALFLALRAYTQRGAASGIAPPLIGEDLAGKTVSLSGLRGKSVLVHFWATWCPICTAESATVNDLARDHVVLTVASSSGQAREIRADMDRRGLSFPVVVDPDGEIARTWGVRAFPTSFFVSPCQQIRFSETGFTTSPGFRARLWVAGH